ncbi:hypothetical protein PR048_018688 [Dryococelus australis]|uniref:Uncharacterized protein n=1 Tax=Dryococelus australis TaxID=614101 RepID=A0ABQ9HD44_9NEOP|nr:hypothetical protein PR048_018688 [Dryococelus australis]
MEQCWNKWAGQTGDPRENPTTSGIVRNDWKPTKIDNKTMNVGRRFRKAIVPGPGDVPIQINGIERRLEFGGTSTHIIDVQCSSPGFDAGSPGLQSDVRVSISLGRLVATAQNPPLLRKEKHVFGFLDAVPSSGVESLFQFIPETSDEIEVSALDWPVIFRKPIVHKLHMNSQPKWHATWTELELAGQRHLPPRFSIAKIRGWSSWVLNPVYLGGGEQSNRLATGSRNVLVANEQTARARSLGHSQSWEVVVVGQTNTACHFPPSLRYSNPYPTLPALRLACHARADSNGSHYPPHSSSPNLCESSRHSGTLLYTARSIQYTALHGIVERLRPDEVRVRRPALSTADGSSGPGGPLGYNHSCLTCDSNLQTGRGKREIPEKTLRPTASSGTIPTCENPVTRPGIEPGNPLARVMGRQASPPGSADGCGCATPGAARGQAGSRSRSRERDFLVYIWSHNWLSCTKKTLVIVIACSSKALPTAECLPFVAFPTAECLPFVALPTAECLPFVALPTAECLPFARMLDSHQRELGSIPGCVTSDFRMWEPRWTMLLVGGFSRLADSKHAGGMGNELEERKHFGWRGLKQRAASNDQLPIPHAPPPNSFRARLFLRESAGTQVLKRKASWTKDPPTGDLRVVRGTNEYLGFLRVTHYVTMNCDYVRLPFDLDDHGAATCLIENWLSPMPIL